MGRTRPSSCSTESGNWRLLKLLSVVQQTETMVAPSHGAHKCLVVAVIYIHRDVSEGRKRCSVRCRSVRITGNYDESVRLADLVKLKRKNRVIASTPLTKATWKSLKTLL
ncbi:hypothetical protein O9992_23525 [Vibrio lentus]|nr:hypothetical protein [Vibrio lentus]